MQNPKPSQRQRVLTLVPGSEPETVSQYLNRWLSSRRALRATTVRCYESHIRLHLNPHLGHLPLKGLTHAHVDVMYDDLFAVGRLSTASVTRVHATLMSALNAAVRAGLIDRNPAALVELPRAVRREHTVWEPSELMTFLDANIDDPHHALFALLGLRGLRRGEALALRWADIDLDAKQLKVTRQLSHYRGVVTFGPRKSNAGNRVVAIDEWLARILYLHGCQQRLTGKINDWTPDDHSLVFTDEQGDPLNPIGVTRHFDHLVRESGLPRIRLHDLRHTSATIGLASGESLLEVSRRLGHSSIGITADLYSEVSTEAAKAAADRMATYLLSRR